MGKIVTQASMSLDGFIADASDAVGPLFDWYDNRDVEVIGSDPGLVSDGRLRRPPGVTAARSGRRQ